MCRATSINAMSNSNTMAANAHSRQVEAASSPTIISTTEVRLSTTVKTRPGARDIFLMHNVKRLSAEQRAKQRAENEERARHYSSLSQAAMALRRAGQLDEQSLGAAARVLTCNPDHATLWNFRRQVLSHLHADEVSADGDSPPDDATSPRGLACEREMELTQQCLMLNPKSYPVWFHRMWVIKWGRCSWRWATELKLTAKMLALDERNFHCWTYRRFLVSEASVPLLDELSFVMSKIETNFSNYSAWHYRSKLLPQVYGTIECAAIQPTDPHVGLADPAPAAAPAVQPAKLASVLTEELKLLHNAFFTAPEDQSAWFYHRWVLAQLEALATPAAAHAAAEPSSGSALASALANSPASNSHALTAIAHEETLRGELAMLNDLLEMEPECKWPLATATFIGQALRIEPAQLAEQLRTLQRIDSARRNFYERQLAELPA